MEAHGCLIQPLCSFLHTYLASWLRSAESRFGATFINISNGGNKKIRSLSKKVLIFRKSTICIKSLKYHPVTYLDNLVKFHLTENDGPTIHDLRKFLHILDTCASTMKTDLSTKSDSKAMSIQSIQSSGLTVTAIHNTPKLYSANAKQSGSTLLLEIRLRPMAMSMT